MSTAISGMQAASWQLDGAAGVVASFGDGSSSGDDLIEAMVEVDQAPLAYAANARVIKAEQETTASLLDAFA